MTFDAKALLISVQEAHRLHQAGGVHFLDATYFASSEPLKATDEYAAGHLPGAAFFAIEAIADHSNPLPHMLPPLAEGEAALRALGINNADLVVVYDRPRLRSAPRVWWMLRYFGHQNVVVLDGGYAAWVEAGFPVETGAAVIAQGDFTARLQPAFVAELDRVITAAKTGDALILDARPADRFSGKAGDSWTPRKGHVTGSVSLPSSKLLTPEGRLKSVEELQAIFAPLLDGRPVITSCGSGIAASTMALALAVIGRQDVAVFDGSWAEWGNSPLTEELTSVLEG